MQLLQHVQNTIAFQVERWLSRRAVRMFKRHARGSPVTRCHGIDVHDVNAMSAPVSVALVERLAAAIGEMEGVSLPYYRWLINNVKMVLVANDMPTATSFAPQLRALMIDRHVLEIQPITGIAAYLVIEACHARVWRTLPHYRLLRSQRVSVLALTHMSAFVRAVPSARFLVPWADQNRALAQDIGQQRASMFVADLERLELMRQMGLPRAIIALLDRLARTRRSALE